MKILKIPFAVLMMLFLFACDKDDETTTPQAPTTLDENVKLDVQVKFSSENLEIGTYYTNVEGFEVEVGTLRFYLSDIYLTRDDGEDVLLSDLDFFDLENTEMTRSYSVPVGTYTGYKYSLGVPLGSNGTEDTDFNPAQFGPDHPLSIDNGMYWSWSSGYRFVVFEGRTDTLPQSSSNIPYGYAIHTGHDQFFKTFDYTGQIDISDTDLTKLKIVMDIDRFMYNESDTLHFNTQEDTQLSGAVTDLAFKFSDMLDGAISSDVE